MADNRGLVAANPCAKGGRSPGSTRYGPDDDEANFLAQPPPHLHLMLAIWTGQRQRDPLPLTWKPYDGTHIRLRQSKIKRRVVIPVGAPLKAMLDGTARTGSSDGQRGTSDGFAASWRKARAAAGIVGLTFIT